MKPGTAVLLPTDSARAALLGPLPEGASLTDASGTAEVAVLDAPDMAALEALVPRLSGLAGARAVWILYPKGRTSDITRDTIRERIEREPWTTVAIIAVDDAHSALRIKPVG